MAMCEYSVCRYGHQKSIRKQSQPVTGLAGNKVAQVRLSRLAQKLAPFIATVRDCFAFPRVREQLWWRLAFWQDDKPREVLRDLREFEPVLVRHRAHGAACSVLLILWWRAVFYVRQSTGRVAEVGRATAEKQCHSRVSAIA